MKKLIRSLAMLLVTLGSSNLSAQIIFTKLDLSIDPDIGLNGIAWCDYNDDGWMDFYHPGNKEDSRLYKSVGGTFINMSPPDNDVFLDLTGIFSTGAVWGDFDNDGDPDIFACDLSLKIYRSDNFGESWTEISESAGLGNIDIDRPIWMVTAADYDGDGDLDVAEAGSDQGVITGIASPIRILKNNDMVFTDVAPTLIGFDINLESWNPMWVDVDNDGDSDLFMPTIRTPNQPCVLLINNGGVSFVQTNNNVTGLNCSSAITSSWADYNNDGYMDLFAVPYGGGVAQLYKNNGNLTFTDMAPTYGLNSEYADTRTCHWADYDNDGDNDLIISQSSDLIHFWRNDNNGFTRDNETEASLGNVGENKRMTQFVDYDNDGFLDLWVGNFNGPKYLIHNGGNSNHWLGIIPKGITNNKTGVGARIRVVTGTRSQVRDIQAGGGGMSGGYTRGHFGLAGVTIVDSLIVRWPNGMVDVFTNVAADKYYICTEGGTMTELQPAVVHQNDVGISMIVVPSQVEINKPVTISAVINNYGKDSQDNFLISYQVDSENCVTETFNQTLAMGRTTTYEFSTKWTPSTLGWHLITVNTSLNGDQNTDNDSLKKNVQVNDAVYFGTQDFRVNEIEGTCEQYVTSIAVDGAGNFVIAWVDYRLVTQDIYAQRYNSEGIAQGQNFIVNTGSGGQTDPSIAINESGNFVIAWLDGRNFNLDIYAQRYNSSGEEQGTNFKVNDNTGSSEQVAPSIAMDGAGNFVIVWEDYRNDDYFSDIYAQRYNSSGEMQGKNFKVNDTPISWGRYPSIAIDGSGNFVIAWQDGRNGNYDIYAQRYNSSGEEQGTNFKVNDDTGSEDQNYPSIAINESGNFAIAWQDRRNMGVRDIYAQRYNSNGEEQGTNFRVNDDPENSYNYHFEPSIAIDESGNFIIVWYDDRNYDNDIYAQRYNSSGTPIGNNFRVTAEWNKDKGQVSPDVKLWDNKIYNCWASRQIGGTGYDIWANVLVWNRPLSVREPISGNRLSYQLFQNYPNPFNPNTTIEYSLLHKTFVSLKVFDILGQEILTLVECEQPSGYYRIQFTNHDLPSGVYIYKLETDDFMQSKRMIVLK